MEEMLAFFEPEMLYILPCRQKTKIYLKVELNTNINLPGP